MHMEKIKCCDISGELFGSLPREPRSGILEKAKSQMAHSASGFTRKSTGRTDRKIVKLL